MTTSAHEWLRHALDHGIELQQSGGKLRCKVPGHLLAGDALGAMARHKQALIELLQAHGCEGVLAGRASAAQRRMWFVHRLAPDSPLYNEPVMLKLEGPLDFAALRGAFDAVMARHTALRTVFLEVGEELCQVVMPPASVPPLALADLRAPGGPRPADAEAIAIVEDQAMRPFDLARGPLVRAQLFRTGEDRHLLGMVWHHICIDQGSMDLLLREVSMAYEAGCRGLPPGWPELPLQYADFARWQAQALAP